MTPLDQLRVNIKTLNARSTILRQEEARKLRIARRLKGQQGREVQRARAYDSHTTVHQDRTVETRRTLRHLHITRAVIREKALYHLEDPQYTRSPVDWDRVVEALMLFKDIGRNEARAVVDNYIEKSYQSYEEFLLAREEHAAQTAARYQEELLAAPAAQEVAAE